MANRRQGPELTRAIVCAGAARIRGGAEKARPSGPAGRPGGVGPARRARQATGDVLVYSTVTE